MLKQPFAFGFVVVAILTAAGCGDRPGANGDATVIPTESAEVSKEPRANQRRFGPIFFVPPAGWDEAPSKVAKGFTFRLPEAAPWTKLGFRPTIGIRVRELPGVTTDKLEQHMQEMLAQSASDLDDDAKTAIREVYKTVAAQFRLTDHHGFKLTRESLDTCDVLVSVFDGVFKLPKGKVALRTRTLGIPGRNRVYTVTFTYPLTVAKELQPVWRKFRKQLNVNRSELESTE